MRGYRWKYRDSCSLHLLYNKSLPNESCHELAYLPGSISICMTLNTVLFSLWVAQRCNIIVCHMSKYECIIRPGFIMSAIGFQLKGTFHAKQNNTWTSFQCLLLCVWGSLLTLKVWNKANLDCDKTIRGGGLSPHVTSVDSPQSKLSVRHIVFLATA